MRKILTIVMLMVTVAVSAQTVKRLRVYQNNGVVDTLLIQPGSTIAHSRLNPDGQQHPDYVSLIVTISNLQRQFLLADIDSLVLPNGHTVVFRGRTADLPLLQEGAGRRLGAPLHTSFSGTFPGGSGVTYYWTENDHIRLETGQESRATGLTNDNREASFVFEDFEEGADQLVVYYPDREVTIQTHQTQTGANNSDHIGVSGDCGVATATRDDTPPGEDGGGYSFSLRHQAAYLCFLPHTDHLPSVRVTKIDVACSHPIAGTYEMAPAGLIDSRATSKTISLDLVPSPASERDFFLGHNRATEQDSCAAYMVIAPQSETQTFTVTYHLVDTLSRFTTTYQQTFSLRPQANTVYPVGCRIPESLFQTVDMGYDYQWSSVNVGSDLPNESGDFHTWQAAQDALTDDWNIPAEDAVSELVDKCTWTWGNFNGTDGWMVEGTNNGNVEIGVPRIFLPQGGYKDGGTTQHTANGYYWTDGGDATVAIQPALILSPTTRQKADMAATLAMNTRPTKAIPREYRIPYSGTEYLDLRTHGPGCHVKVYDHAGPDANYDNNANGCLLITCAEGYKLNITGRVSTEEYGSPCDPFEVYDGATTSAPMIAQVWCPNRTVNATTTSNQALLRFASDTGKNEAGVDVTVTIQRTYSKYHVTFADVVGGTMTASTTEANPEDTITLTAHPADGYILDHIKIETDGEVLTLYEDDPMLKLSSSLVSRHYLMNDTVCTVNANWYNDQSTFLMPYGDVVVTPFFITNTMADYVWMAAHDTTYVRREYLQRLLDSGVDAFRFCDNTGPTGQFDAWGAVDGSHTQRRSYLYVDAPVGYVVEINGRICSEPGYDILYAYDGNSLDNPQLMQESGRVDLNTWRTEPFAATTHTNRALLYFDADWGNNGMGYDGTMRLVPCTPTEYRIPAHGRLDLHRELVEYDINQHITSLKVYDHAGPDANYASNVNGMLLMELPEGWRAHVYGTLNTEDYATESDPLGVYDGTTTDAPCLFYQWGQGQTVDVTTTSNKVLLYFKSDSGTESSGVDLTVDFIPPVTP